MSGKYKAFLATFVALAVASGCAKEREPRSYVQPNIIAKRDLKGLWHYAPTVVDIGYGSSVTFIGETSMDVAIIKWDIQEDVVYARLAYDRVRGTESEHNPLDEVAFKGEPMGAWAVEHFDIIRDYNPTTGEETNVLKESKERPWYDREFLRIDWSKNLVSNWNWMWERTVQMDPVSYFQTDPDHPHAPKIERNQNDEAVYIGITTKELVTPQMREYGYSGIDELPDCFFYDDLSKSCTSTEVVVRHAFARLDPDKEYHPREYSQVEMDDYGYFLTQRLTYSRDYGVTVGGITWYANRFNLYDEWYRKATDSATASLHANPAKGNYTCPADGNPCRYVDGTKVFIKARKVYTSDQLPPDLQGATNEVHCRCDGQGAECSEPCFYVSDGSPVYVEDHEGSEKYVMRPYNRPLKPIVYFLNETFPDNLEDTAQSVIDQWADVFNMSVWLAAGCSKTDYEVWKQGQENRCDARPEFDDPDFKMVVMCPNPVVQEGDPPECGPVGREVRLGDIRYNHLVWVDAPQQYSPLGYGPPLGDPLTGEVISAIANIYGAPLDSYSVYARDIVRMLTDQNFQWEDYLWGRLQWDFVKEQGAAGSYRRPQAAGRDKRGVRPDGPRRRSWESRTYTKADIRRLFGNMNFDWTRAIPPSTAAPAAGGGKLSAEETMEWARRRQSTIARTGVLGNGTNPQQARINLLRDTYWEDLMMTPDHLMSNAATLQAAGYDVMNTSAADLPYGSEIRKKVSPLYKHNIKRIRAMNQIKFGHAAKTIMYPEFFPFVEPSTIGLASELVCTLCCSEADRDQEGNCSNIEACKADVNLQTNRWSADGQCADRVKWAVREKIFDGVAVHEMGHNFGLRHNFKGSYDAMNYFDEYWQIRVANTPQGEVISPRTIQPRTHAENLAKITQYQYTSIMDYGAKFNSDFSGLGRHDYASILHTYAGFTQVFNTVEQRDDIAWFQTFRQFSWPTPVYFYTTMPPEALLYTQIHYDETARPDGAVDTSESNRDWVPKPWLYERTTGGNAWMTDPAVESKAGGSNSRIMVPYKMCADEFRNTSLGCNVFDEGADLYEITENVIQMYENYYVFNNFGRDRLEWGWNDDSYVGRIYGRYFDLLQNHLQYYVLYATIFHDWGIWSATEVEQFFADDETGWGTYTVAVSRGFDTLMRAMNYPQPGYYVQRQRMNGETYWYRDTEPQYSAPPNVTCGPTGGAAECFLVDHMNGKFWDDTWDFNLGYQWYLKKVRIGQFLDRPLAIQVLGEATNNFMGRDTQEDVRKYTINFARVYNKQIDATFQALMSQDLRAMAPSFCGFDSNGNAIIEHRDVTNMTAPRCSLTGGTFEGYVDPGDTFTTQLYAATWGMAMFPMNYSQEFLDRSRIYVAGNGEGIDWSQIPPEAEVVEFTDPFSFKSYQSVRYPDDGVEVWDEENQTVRMASGSIGARMLDEAESIKAQYEYWETEYVNATPGTAAYEEAYNNMTVFETNLKNYVINLDMVRSLSYRFEHPSYTLD